ncbi:hypothetical protein KW790_00685 [Candidatus Parcubacteria bacterium]|nr:hypothetical protein [Candidatus Parcubacteria bacterium]
MLHREHQDLSGKWVQVLKCGSRLHELQNELCVCALLQNIVFVSEKVPGTDQNTPLFKFYTHDGAYGIISPNEVRVIQVC